MPNINDSFSSKYLRANDIGPEGASIVVTIARIGQETIKNRETQQNESKPTLEFRELDKPLVLNKTNAKKISTLLKSSNTDDWIDQPIQLYATETQYGVDTVACIRVRQAALPTGRENPRAPKPAPMAASNVDDGDPF